MRQRYNLSIGFFAVVAWSCLAKPASDRAIGAGPTTMVTTQQAVEYPKSWIDPDTGHQVHRITDEPSSGVFYFNINPFSPDGRVMAYIAPDGIRALNLENGQSKLLAPGNAKPVMVARKTPTLYYVDGDQKTICSVALDGSTPPTTIAKLPPRATVSTINADETLAAGTYIEGTAGQDYGTQKVVPKNLEGPNVQPLNKGEMMEKRLAAKLPLVLFTIDLKSGKQTTLLNSTDWINHLLFSPSDPTLLMYCHEGPWHKVDRIWTIKIDGAQNRLVHTRTMAMEIAGHEFWGQDGKTIWYDLQRPKGQSFFLSSFGVDSGRRRWYSMTRDEWSVHFNVSNDEQLMCGDGGDPSQVARAEHGQWIYLFHPVLARMDGVNQSDLIQPGVLHSEKLFNMAKHDYKQEPNVHFSPDQKQVIFTSNTLGPSFAFAVDVSKSTQ